MLGVFCLVTLASLPFAEVCGQLWARLDLVLFAVLTGYYHRLPVCLSC